MRSAVAVLPLAAAYVIVMAIPSSGLTREGEDRYLGKRCGIVTILPRSWSVCDEQYAQSNGTRRYHYVSATPRSTVGVGWRLRVATDLGNNSGNASSHASLYVGKAGTIRSAATVGISLTPLPQSVVTITFAPL